MSGRCKAWARQAGWPPSFTSPARRYAWRPSAICASSRCCGVCTGCAGGCALGSGLTSAAGGAAFVLGSLGYKERNYIEPDLAAQPADLLAASAEVEARLSQEEEIERRTAGTHAETPHFRKEVD